MIDPPFEKSFSEQLNWHLQFGTRPGGTPGVRGEPWLVRDFVNQLYRVSKGGADKNTIRRNIGHWRNGNPCQHKWLVWIDAALFGSNPAYETWSLRFREAAIRQRGERKFRFEASGPRLRFGRPITKRRVLEKVYRFDERSYVDEDGELTKDISFDLFCDWWEEFPNGFLCALQDDEPVAVVGLFPVTEAWARRFLQRNVNEHELHRSVIRNAIEEARESPRTHWYLSGLSSNLRPQHLSTHLPRILGYALLEWLRCNASSIGSRTVIMVSEGTTENGERLLRDHFRFKLERGATRAGEKPLFSAETNLAQIRNLLTRHDMFSRCPDLQRDIQDIQ